MFGGAEYIPEGAMVWSKWRVREAASGESNYRFLSRRCGKTPDLPEEEAHSALRASRVPQLLHGSFAFSFPNTARS